MDAIDLVRAQLAAHDTRLEQLEHAQKLFATDVEMALREINVRLTKLSLDQDQTNVFGALNSGQIIDLKQAVFSLTNQVAIVAATLGTAIHALKKGDSEASDKALSDALEMQDRLGQMIDSQLGPSK